MNLRTGFYIFCSVVMIYALTSCLGSDDPEVTIPIDAQITSFTVSHDSVPALDSAIFSIDHFKGLIYNHDSLRYGVEVNEKVIATFVTSAYAVVDITHSEDGDSTIISSGDSLDLRQVAKLRVYAYSGVTKVYEVKLNIHTVDPDSVQYKQIANNLDFLDADYTKSVYFGQKFYTYAQSVMPALNVKVYSSSDAVNWQEEQSSLPGNVQVSDIQNTGEALFAYTGSGDLYRSTNALSWQKVTTEYPVKAFFGRIEKSPTQDAGYTLLVVKDGKNIPAFTPDFKTWLYGPEIAPDFPVTGYSAVNYYKMLQDRVTVVGGKNSAGNSQNSVWSTSNGLYWAKLTGTQGLFPVLDRCNVFSYNNMFYLLNGKLEDGTYNRVTYISKDGGTTWQADKEKTYVPEDYSGRYGASVVVAKDNYFYTIGGRQTEVPLKDVWTGVLNKLTFNNN